MNSVQNTTVSLSHVRKAYAGKLAVDDVSFDVPQASIFGLLGPNGAGKTSTIRMINGITLPDAGSITVLGSNDLTHARSNIGYMPEERGLYRKLPVREQLQYLGQLKGMTGRDLEQRIDHWLDLFEIRAWEKKRTNELSKGMHQKLQFIATVLHDPDLLILDEPLSGLDPINAQLINDLLLDMRRSGKTIILSTHRMEQVEQLCDEIALLSDGRVVLSGRLRDLKSASGRTLVALRFYGDPGFLDSLEHASVLERAQNEALIEYRTKEQAASALPEIASRVELTRWERVEPPIRELFLEAVRSNGSMKVGERYTSATEVAA